jgi:hypothetical protein
MNALNKLDVALQQAQTGQLSLAELLATLMDSEVAVPSATEILQDGTGMQPLLFPKEGVQMLACFTDKSRIGEFSALAPYCLVLTGRELLRRIPAGYGLVVNPGTPIGFDVSPEGVARIVKDFAVR